MNGNRVLHFPRDESWWLRGMFFMYCIGSGPEAAGQPLHAGNKRPAQGSAWGLVIKEGVYGTSKLDDLRAFLLQPNNGQMQPPRIPGGLYVDYRSTPEQSRALRAILTGDNIGYLLGLEQPAGGDLETAFAPIELFFSEASYTLHIQGVISATMELDEQGGRFSSCLAPGSKALAGTSAIPSMGVTHVRTADYHFMPAITHGLYAHVLWNGGLKSRFTASVEPTDKNSPGPSEGKQGKQSVPPRNP